MKRIFIGVELKEAHEKINNHIEELKNEHNNVRVKWEKMENIHLTLKFLGNVSEEQLVSIKNALVKIAEYPKFAMSVEKTGCFPFQRNASVLWLGINEPNGILQKIHYDIETELELIGFAKEKRGYTPHLTIARLKYNNHTKNIVDSHMQKQFDPAELIVSKIIIYQSVLHPTGSVYSVVDTIDLK